MYIFTYYVINYRQIEHSYNLPPQNNIFHYRYYFPVRTYKKPEILNMCPVYLSPLVLALRFVRKK